MTPRKRTPAKPPSKDVKLPKTWGEVKQCCQDWPRCSCNLRFGPSKLQREIAEFPAKAKKALARQEADKALADYLSAHPEIDFLLDENALGFVQACRAARKGIGGGR